MDWAAAEQAGTLGKAFCLKALRSAEDARRAVDIGGCHHGLESRRQAGWQPITLDQLAEIVDAVGDRIDAIATAAFSGEPMSSRRCPLGQKPARAALVFICAGGRWEA